MVGFAGFLSTGKNMCAIAHMATRGSHMSISVVSELTEVDRVCSVCLRQLYHQQCFQIFHIGN